MLLWLVTQSSPMKDCVTSWKNISLSSCHTSHATMCGHPGWPIMALLWMPSLWKNLFFFLFLFLFFNCWIETSLIFLARTLVCVSHKLSYNPYCTVACSVGERWWWIHTVSALHSSLQAADSQIPLDLCIVLSTKLITTVWKTSPNFFHVSPTVKLLLANYALSSMQSKAADWFNNWQNTHGPLLQLFVSYVTG